MAGRKRRVASGKVEQSAAGLIDPRDRRLHFAHLNGQRRAGAEVVCGPVRMAFERCCRAPAWRRQLAALLEEQVGAEVLAGVRGFEVCRGELRLEVAEPAARYALGLRWQQRLLVLLRTRLPAAGITGVRFVSPG